ncbi:hypothetical protein Agub_g2756 [Astrephomene gubernaculifera]|uniref:Uncharacterized protein n=1 Tax=Astrephomene gubernaculifera TaxID=47775 RepID=A0AAD3HHX5_9CHLO|nr:hypothetical protein Agub_g2756 [Astrephomene gubernaculifera]
MLAKDRRRPPLILFSAYVVLQLCASVSSSDADDLSSLPHVDSCNYCFECLPSPSGHHHRNLQQSTTSSSLATHQHTTTTTHNTYARGRGRGHTRGSGALGARIRKGGGAAALSTSTSAPVITDPVWANEPDGAYLASAASSGIPGALANPHAVQPVLIAPGDHESKQLLPNCSRCVGCSSELQDMHAAPVEAEGLGGLAFMHGKGATNGWLFFGRVAGSSKRYIVKVYCMPYSKAHGRPQGCAAGVYTERLRLMMAQVRLADECGAVGSTPRVWVAPVNAIVPNGTYRGYHIRWHGLWMEEAPGITLHALHTAEAGAGHMFQLLTQKINKTQVVQQTVLDLLTAQCDRHSENVFITPAGQLTFIDNDRALGVVTRCGGDSMLLPGNRYHTQLRLGYWGNYLDYYRSHAGNPAFCTGPIDMRVIIDYRCYVPGGTLGTSYPPGLAACMRDLAAHKVPDIMARYGFTSRKPAEILKRRARDMLSLGFEAALASSPPRSAPRYVYQQQPPCCGLVRDLAGKPRCATCWKPVLEAQKDGVRDSVVAAAAKEVLLGPDE